MHRKCGDLPHVTASGLLLLFSTAARAALQASIGYFVLQSKQPHSQRFIKHSPYLYSA
jgi:hypothetical protein